MTPINRFTVSFVGAGPGDVELITVKGRRLLDAADVIIHAGSLVNRELLDGCTADIHDSSGLNLDEIVELMVAAWQKGCASFAAYRDRRSTERSGNRWVRLEAASIPCEVIPGVSSAFAAAASLKAELTLPEVAQTVIITRQEGRTPVPAREKLSLLASHQTTMLISCRPAFSPPSSKNSGPAAIPAIPRW